jgi:hypothetical protein
MVRFVPLRGKKIEHRQPEDDRSSDRWPEIPELHSLDQGAPRGPRVTLATPGSRCTAENTRHEAGRRALYLSDAAKTLPITEDDDMRATKGSRFQATDVYRFWPASSPDGKGPAMQRQTSNEFFNSWRARSSKA